MDKQPLVVHLGSNMGQRENYLAHALQLLELAFGKPLITSSIYETKAWGIEEQRDFLNMAVIFETGIPAEEAIKTIKRIETETGRKQREHWHEREIDMDIIFYGNQVIDMLALKIPHPNMQHRNFVLIPLNEMCPDFIHPVSKQTVSELTKRCTDNLEVKKWTP